MTKEVWLLLGIGGLVLAWASQQSGQNAAREQRRIKLQNATVNYNSSGQAYASLVDGSGLNNQSGRYSTGFNLG